MSHKKAIDRSDKRNKELEDFATRCQAPDLCEVYYYSDWGYVCPACQEDLDYARMCADEKVRS